MQDACDLLISAFSPEHLSLRGSGRPCREGHRFCFERFSRRRSRPSSRGYPLRRSPPDRSPNPWRRHRLTVDPPPTASAILRHTNCLVASRKKTLRIEGVGSQRVKVAAGERSGAVSRLLSAARSHDKNPRGNHCQSNEPLQPGAATGTTRLSRSSIRRAALCCPSSHVGWFRLSYGLPAVEGRAPATS